VPEDAYRRIWRQIMLPDGDSEVINDNGRKIQRMFRLISKNSLLLWIASLVFLAACKQANAATTPTLAPTLPIVEPTVTLPPGTPSHGNEIGGYIELIDTLRAAGARVEPDTTVEQPFFEVTGQIIKVDGLDVQVFEFPDEITRESVSSLITPEGQPNPTSIVDWVDQPNFWAKGQVIVLYVGKDQSVIGLLSEVLGASITTP
jgi:hypothetical protein